MKIELQLTGIDGVLATLQSLPAEVVSRRGGPVKTALRKGAVVILKAEKANLLAVMGHQVDGQERASTGLLLKNLIASRGKAPNDGKGERYLVRVKRRNYVRGGKVVTTNQNAARLEYGTSKQPAEPFIRPAVLVRGAEAIATIERELVAGIDKIVAKLAAQNASR